MTYELTISEQVQEMRAFNKAAALLKGLLQGIPDTLTQEEEEHWWKIERASEYCELRAFAVGLCGLCEDE